MNKFFTKPLLLIAILAISYQVSICAFKFCSLFSSDSNTVTGSGTIISESRDIKNFEKIDFNTVGSLEIKQGETESLTIEADDNIVPMIETTVHNKKLVIKTTKNTFFKNVKLNITITVVNLSKIKMLGVGSVTMASLKTPSLKIRLTGTGSITIDKLDTESLDSQLTGAGNIAIKSGNATEQTISISGCGSFNGKNLSGKSGKVSVSGVGSAKVNLKKLTSSKNICGSIKNYSA